MELEGLKRALTLLDVHEVEVAQLVTDRHPQVKKYLSTEKPGIEHPFDTWHVDEGVNKKLLTASKAKGCFVIRLWAKSIVKHLYFSVHRGAGTEAFEKLSLLTAKRLLNNIRQISPQKQTYSVESFHVIINRFAPKSYACILLI
ncbi:hypothetical protein HPB51_016218 [Rhipicephalus microplus]|uniref:Uncharacterized protein n=1 Tax=Rhipicephalus microplus TaxID=6941 RepID=A0A9J6EAH5_RHIMP|nr:hypothetical protein HPB51_016218 [Rhipicephalus microplus]